MNENSLIAWEAIAGSPYIPESRRRVAKIIYDNPGITDKSIAARLGIGINCVTPRRGELMAQGVVVRVKTAFPPVDYWAINAHPVIVPYKKKVAVQATIEFPKEPEFEQQEMFI